MENTQTPFSETINNRYHTTSSHFVFRSPFGTPPPPPPFKNPHAFLFRFRFHSLSLMGGVACFFILLGLSVDDRPRSISPVPPTQSIRTHALTPSAHQPIIVRPQRNANKTTTTKNHLGGKSPHIRAHLLHRRARTLQTTT